MSEDNGKLPTANDVNVLDWDEDGDSESPTPTTATDSKKASEPKQPKPEVKTPEPKAKKKVRFHSKREQFGATVRPKHVTKDGSGRVVNEVPAKNINFVRYEFLTDDEECIKWLEDYMELHPDGEVFKLPEIDPLLEEGLVDRLDSMQLDELRAAARQRGVDFKTIDDLSALRYKLLKHIGGFSKLTEKKS